MVHNKYYTIDQICRKTIYTKSQLRNWTTDRNKNGLAVGMVKLGERIFIDKEFFDQWAIDNKKRVSTRKYKPRHRNSNNVKPPRERKAKVISIPEGFMAVNATPTGEKHGHEGVCGLVKIPHRTGFFRRILDGILRG